MAEGKLRALDLTKLSPSQKSRYYETFAQTAENRKDVIEAVKARIKMDENLTDMQRRKDNVIKLGRYSVLRIRLLSIMPPMKVRGIRRLARLNLKPIMTISVSGTIKSSIAKLEIRLSKSRCVNLFP